MLVKDAVKTVLISLMVICGVLSAIAREPAGTIISGEVVKITDGDTVTILTESKEQLKIRLAEIDTPERRQPYYQRAKQALGDRIFRKQVLVTIVSWDRYGRAVGSVQLEGQDVNAWMVEQGHAWVYRKYSDSEELLLLEDAARENQMGLWALSEAQRMAPWDWRKAH